MTDQRRSCPNPGSVISPMRRPSARAETGPAPVREFAMAIDVRHGERTATRAAEAGAEPRSAVSGGPIVEARWGQEELRHRRVQVQALQRRDCRCQPGRDGRDHGPSGSGKTTLLNCLSGLDEIDGGDVPDRGGLARPSMSDHERTDYRARRMGFVFQFYNLMPVLTAVENVAAAAGGRVPRRRRAGGRSRRSTSSASASGRRTYPRSCPAGSASG